MGMPHPAEFVIDRKKVSDALKAIEVATADCSDDDLAALHCKGILPTGILNYILACRARVI